MRKAWLNSLILPDDFYNFSETDKMKFLFNDPECIKPTAQFIINAFDFRSKLNYGL